MIPNKIKELLKSISTVYKENDKNIIIRCPYCGDSKNPRHAHLYISKTDPPYPFHCFRAECEVSGTITKLLKDLDLLDKVDNTFLQELYKNRQSIQKYQINHNILKPAVRTILDNKDDYSIFKLDYVKQRLGIDTIPNWFAKFIVTDFTEVVQKVKNMNSLVRKNLQQSYIGFLTYNKKKIVCRRIDDNKTFLPRYYHVNLEDDIDYFVTFPNDDIEFLSSSGSIIIGEGVFDVVNGYLTLHNDMFNDKNIILISSLGKGYFPAYNYILKKFGLSEWNVYLFVDNDISDRTIKKIFRYVTSNPIYIVRNRQGKDMGSEVVEPTLTKL